MQCVTVLGLLALLCCSSIGTVRGGKIVVMPVDGSHWLSLKILVEELSQKGHKMVVLIPEANYHIRNGSYTTRTFKVPYTKADLDAPLDMIKKWMLKAPGFFDIVKNVKMMMNFTEMLVKGCEGLLYNEPLMRSLREQGFDLMLTDPFLPCGTIIADAFSIPAVYFLRGMICGLDVEAAQCPSPPSYVPRFFIGNTDAMTFQQRVKNMLMVGVDSILCHTLYRSFDELASRYLKKDITYKQLLGHRAIWFMLGTVRGGKIVVMPVDGSNWLSMKILVEELSQKGHEMVVLVPEANYYIRNGSYTTRTFKVPYTEAGLDASLDMIKKGMLKAPGFFDIPKSFKMIINFTEMLLKGCEGLLYDQPLMRSLREQGFDLMLTNPFQPCGTIIADAFSIPVVHSLHWMICGLDLEAAQCPSPPSYVPRVFTGNTDAMTFPQRVKNMVTVGVESILCQTLYGGFDELASRYLEKDTTYKQLLGLGAIWFMMYDFTFEYPRPIMPNVVMVGGLNCAKKKPLPAVSFAEHLSFPLFDLIRI
ncbi:hypothetical protein MHYP_G00062450 [Metynnis hypsauchen]